MAIGPRIQQGPASQGLTAAVAAGLLAAIASLWAFRGLPLGTLALWLTPFPLFAVGLAFGPVMAIIAAALAALLVVVAGGGVPALVFLVLFGVPACRMGGWAKHGPCGSRQFGPRPGMGGRCGPFQRRPAAFIPPFLRPFIVAEEGKEVNWEQINDIVGNIAQQLFGELKPEEDQEETKKEEEASSTPSTTDQEKPASEASTSANAPVERERASSVTETVKTENEQGWTHLEAEQVEGAIKVRENSAEKTTQSPSANVTTAAALSETELKNQRIEDALKAMSDMGFPNEGKLLRRLLNNYNGDVARVLDSIK